MNQLIPTITGELAGEIQPLVNARDLHAVMEVGKDFSNWIKERIEKYGFTEGEDYSPVLANRSYGFGKPKTEYHLSLDMAKELAIVEGNDKGRQARRYFIQMEKVARQEIPAFLRRPLEVRPGQVEALQLERLKALALRGMPVWEQLKRYYEMKLTQIEIARLLCCQTKYVRANLREMAAAGLVDYQTNPALSAAGRKGLAAMKQRRLGGGDHVQP